MKETLQFSVDSALLSELGEKIVESVHIALVELIKNAYDADATSVQVKIVPRETGGPEIQVIDNGTGMTFAEVQKYWMRIATTNKAANPVSTKFGRPKTGAKGIGRFCCRRLGTILELKTTAHHGKDSSELTTVVFPWEDFRPGSTVTEIKCEGTVAKLASTESGTTLTISGATADEWTKRGFDFLKREIGVLVANRGAHRDGYEPDPGFNVTLTAPGFSAKNEDLRQKVMDAGWGTITGHFDRAGRAHIELNALGIGRKETNYPDAFKALAGIRFQIGIFAPLREELRDKTAISTGSLRKIADVWGGVQIRHNGFRVYPYGDDDWLHIDRDRGLRATAATGVLREFAAKLKGVNPSRALLNLLSMRSHVGTVEISDKNPGFEMKASREGFIKSREFDSLTSVVRFAIDWATIYRDYHIRLRQKHDAEVARKDFEAVSEAETPSANVVDSAAHFIEQEVRHLANYLPQNQRATLSKRMLSATKAIIEHDKATREEVLHLRLIASTSTLLLIFAHEVKTLLGSLQANAEAMKLLIPQLGKDEAREVAEIGASLHETKRRLSDLLQLTAIVSAGGKGSKPIKIALAEKAQRAASTFKLITDTYNIEIDSSGVADNIMVGPMHEAEVYAILLNLLSNSIKAVIAGGGKSRKISVTASRIGQRVRLSIKDSGIGIQRAHREDAFTPFVSDPQGTLYRRLKAAINPQDSHIVGSGSGLGLSIVKEIVVAHSGEIGFVEPKGNWSTEIQLTLPSK